MTPHCEYQHNPDESCGDGHEGYAHAESWDDVERVMDQGGKVYDRDGDAVIAVHARQAGVSDTGRTSYEYDGGTITAESPFMLLVPITFEPATSEEIAEAIASVLGTN